MNPASLECRHISLSYGATPVLRDVNLKIEPGEFFALLGPSGSGKSTLLRLIAGFNQHQSGELLIDGQDISGVPPHLRGVGMVFQNYALWPHMTVWDNVAFGLVERRESRDAIRRKVGAALELVGLQDYGQRRPGQLSGGQQQRVALARTVVIEPKLLLLDEPLSNLDKQLRVQMREELKNLQRQLGLTTIFVTHDQEEALVLSDRIVLMNGGQIVQSGDAETLYTAPADAFAAGFIGNYNLLDAEAASRLLGQQIGSRVAIRPEAIHFTDGGIEAQIRSHSLLGNVIRYRVEARGVELLVDVLNRSAADLHHDGQSVSLAIGADAIREVA